MKGREKGKEGERGMMGKGERKEKKEGDIMTEIEKLE